MSFTSLWYFPFLCTAAAVYYALDTRLKSCFLLAVSWFVYALFGLPHFLLLLFVTVTGYLCGILTEGREKGKSLVLAAGVLIIAVVLFYYKYVDLFLSLIGTDGIFLRELTFPERHVILPAGISFYTFQSLSYMIDVYRGRKKESSFVKYALYISFFPQLTAGPIEQAGRLIPQLEGRRAELEDFSVGSRYLLSGCVRKFVIADYMAGYVDLVYGNVMQHSGADLLLAAVLFSVQIYCDFSGYTHIAIGSARFLGIRLTENFDRPYLAVGCRDFWKRWHITLTKWFTEYLYIPMGGNRRGERRKYVNIMAVFLLSGLWHGANLTFLCWGAFFGIWRIAEEIAGKAVCRSNRKRTGNKNPAAVWFKRFGTFSLVSLSWVIFRSRSVPEAAEALRRIFFLEGGTALAAGRMELAGAAIRIGILALLPGMLQSREKGEKEVMRSCYTAAVMIFLTAVCMIFMFEHGGDSSFIYFQF